MVGKYLGDDEFWHSFSNFREKRQPTLKNILLKSRPRNTRIEVISGSKYQNKFQQDSNQINNNPKVFLVAVYPQEELIANYSLKKLSKERGDNWFQNEMIVSLLKQIT
ncbi:MAG: hypothetical protein QNJ38_14965 [Prochloraceae cyanobacterium]|nr:hypothetical protein [Prochloraceae cyanobacterium]